MLADIIEAMSEQFEAGSGWGVFRGVGGAAQCIGDAGGSGDVRRSGYCGAETRKEIARNLLFQPPCDSHGALSFVADVSRWP